MDATLTLLAPSPVAERTSEVQVILGRDGSTLDLIEAVESTSELPFDVVFSALVEPDMTGSHWLQLARLQALVGRRWWFRGVAVRSGDWEPAALGAALAWFEALDIPVLIDPAF